MSEHSKRKVPYKQLLKPESVSNNDSSLSQPAIKASSNLETDKETEIKKVPEVMSTGRAAYVPVHKRNVVSKYTKPEIVVTSSISGSVENKVEQQVMHVSSLDTRAPRYIPPALKKKQEDHYKQCLDNLDAKDPFAADMRKAFSNCSEFSLWLDTLVESTGNEIVEGYFSRRPDQNGKSHKHVHAWSEADVLFAQFFRYALEINARLNFVENLRKVSTNSTDKWFCDLGFAPGGMTRLLLDDENNRGVGITLDQNEGGNTWDRELESNERFNIVFADILTVNLDNLPKIANLPENFPGFDLIIIGITVHSDSDSKSQLKHRLLLAQIAFALRWLKPGGSLLTRCYLELELINFHYFALLNMCFETISPAKPMGEFAIRHTFWSLCSNFNPSKSRESLLHISNALLNSESVYELCTDSNNVTILKNTCIFPNLSISDFHEYYPGISKMIELPMRLQRLALKSFMLGKKDRFCKYGKNCAKRKFCIFGHSKNDMIEEVWNALCEVEHYESLRKK